MIRLLLADDESTVRAGVASILATDEQIEVVAEAADGRRAVELARAHRPDIAMLDIRMPTMDGLAAAEEVLRLLPGIAVIMLTTFDEDEYIARALSSGASGFLLKASDPRELILGVRAVAAGAAYLSPRIAHRVITRFDGGGLIRAAPARQRVAGLTARERAVLGLLGQGMSNLDIARRLHVSEGTVKAHVSAILQQLAVRNRVQAAILAYRAGLVDGLGPRRNSRAAVRVIVLMRTTRTRAANGGAPVARALPLPPNGRRSPSPPRPRTACCTLGDGPADDAERW